MRGLGALYEKLRLVPDLVMWRLVGELLDELVCLDVDVLSPRHRLRRPHLPLEEFLARPRLSRSLSATGFLAGVVGASEKVVGVGSGGYDHGCVGAAPDYSFVVHDVLGKVLATV